MSTEPTTAPPPAARPPISLQRFPATLAGPCASSWECPGILPGQRASYVGMPGVEGHKPFRVCEPCADRLEVEFGVTSQGTPAAPSAITTSPAAVVAPPVSRRDEMIEPQHLVMPPEGQETASDLVPWDGPLCECASRADGFHHDPKTGRWVHGPCGRPALRYADGRDTDEPTEPDPDYCAHSQPACDDCRTANSAFAGEGDVLPEGYEPEPDSDEPLDDEPEPDDADAPPVMAEGDDSAEHTSGVGDDEAVEGWHECECARVTKRAKFGLTPGGRYVHDPANCNGLVRDKHLHLIDDAIAEGRAPARPGTEETPSDDHPVPDPPDPAAAAGQGALRGPEPADGNAAEPAAAAGSAAPADPALVGADGGHGHPGAAGREDPAAGGAPGLGLAPRSTGDPVGAAEGEARGTDRPGEGTRGVGEDRDDRGSQPSGGVPGDRGGAPEPGTALGVPGALPGGEAVRPQGGGGGESDVRPVAPAPGRVVADGPDRVAGHDDGIRDLSGAPSWWREFLAEAALDEPDEDAAVLAANTSTPDPTSSVPAWQAAQMAAYMHPTPPENPNGYGPVPSGLWVPNPASNGHAGQVPHVPYGWAPTAPPPPVTPDPTAGMSDADKARAAIAEQRSHVPNPAQFMSGVVAPVLRGNSPWASRYAAELADIVIHYSNNRARSVQRHLGPSEIGHRCDRNVVGKLVGIPATNHVVDPWPSLMGTWGHAGLEEVFAGENARIGAQRWHTERKVTPRFEDHPGTADLYDSLTATLGDHKFLGETAMTKVRSAEGPPIHYVVQMLTYSDGYRRLGFRVDRVALIAWPRTGSTLDGMYVWERPYTSRDEEILEYTGNQLIFRKQWANELLSGRAGLMDVPATPDDSDCYFCPFYRPQAATDGGPGCPGTVGQNATPDEIAAAATVPAGV